MFRIVQFLAKYGYFRSLKHARIRACSPALLTPLLTYGIGVALDCRRVTQNVGLVSRGNDCHVRFWIVGHTSSPNGEPWGYWAQSSYP